MQTLSVQIDDSYMEQFMHFVENSHAKVTIAKDENLERDPYFYERQARLNKIINDVESGKTKTMRLEDFEKNHAR